MPAKEMEANEMEVYYYIKNGFLFEYLILQGTASSACFRVDQYFNFIIIYALDVVFT